MTRTVPCSLNESYRYIISRIFISTMTGVLNASTYINLSICPWSYDDRNGSSTQIVTMPLSLFVLQTLDGV